VSTIATMQTILIVDDDALVRWSLRQTLEKGFDVLEAENGREALETLSAGRVDLVICDLAMDGMDGLALIAEMRRAHVPAKILILTAFDSEDVDRSAFKLGVAGVLQKPVHLPSLFEVVRSHLGTGGVEANARRPRRG